MTPEQRAKKTAYAREWRANLTPEQREKMREKERIRDRLRHMSLTPEQRDDRDLAFRCDNVLGVDGLELALRQCFRRTVTLRPLELRDLRRGDNLGHIDG